MDTGKQKIKQSSAKRAQATPAGKAVTNDASGYDIVALVLQGGGALGAYQAGVYQGLHEAGIRPNWVAGISIGSVNAAIIAGSDPDERIERLRGFWESICRPVGFANLPWGETLAENLQHFPFAFGSSTMNGYWAAAQALIAGQPGFFKPRFPPPYWLSDGTVASTSFYDTAPLLDTLEKYVDFKRLNSGKVRASFGVVNVRSGNFSYFDSTQDTLTPRHILASGALPPGFPAVEVDGEYYWDGGIVSNTPLAQVLDVHPISDTLAFQVDLWPARGALPTSLEQVAERQKDIQYSSRTRMVTDQLQQRLKSRHDLYHLLERLPDHERNRPEWADMRAQACTPSINIVNLIYEAKHSRRNSKDYEFGTEAMREHWAAGLSDIRNTLAKPGILARPGEGACFVAHDIHRSGVHRA